MYISSGTNGEDKKLQTFLFALCYVETGVQNVAVTSKNSTAITVSWSSPVTTSNFVVQYKLTNVEQCRPETGKPVAFPSQTETSLTILGLLPYSTYEISVISDAWPPCLLNEDDVTTVTDESGALL